MMGRWLRIGLMGLILALGIVSMQKIRFNFSLNTLTSERSEEFQQFATYKEQFPSGTGGVVVGIKFDRPLHSMNDFKRLARLTSALNALPNIEATSILSIQLPEKRLTGVTKRKLISFADEKRFEERRDRLVDYPDITPKFLSADRKAGCVYLKTKGNYFPEKELGVLLNNYPKWTFHLTGKRLITKELKDIFSEELVMQSVLAAIVLLLLFYGLFRDLKSLVVVLIMLSVNVSFVFLWFWIFDISVGVLTVSVPLLITVISFCDIVHLVHAFKIQQDGNENRMEKAIGSVKMALWLTSLTTGLAFAIFLFSDVNDIRDFGLMTCLGILSAYISSRWLLPELIAMMRLKYLKKQVIFEKIAGGLIALLKHKRIIGGLGVALTVFCVVFGVYYLKVDHFPDRSLGKSSQIRQSTEFLNKYFDGTRSIEVVMKSSSVLTRENVALVDSIERFLIETYGCRSVFSVNTILKRWNRFENYGLSSQYHLPEEINEETFSELRKHKENLGLMNALTPDERFLKIVGKIPEIGAREAKVRNESLKLFIEPFNSAERKVFVSGHGFVRDSAMFASTELIILGVLFCLTIGMLIIGIVFRSFSTAIIALIPNLLPVSAAIVLIDLSNIPFDPTVAMALSIIVGLSVDDTIYFLRFFKNSKGDDQDDLIAKSIGSNVFPVVSTSLLLAAGFSILVFSTIETNRILGGLVTIILLIALVSDLILLPALLKRKQLRLNA